jgi:hypothetical protein
MSIKPLGGPRAAARLVEYTLGQFAAAAASTGEAERRPLRGRAVRAAAAPAAPQTSEPMPVYVVALDDITEPTFFNAAQRVGWRYVVYDGNAASGVADIHGEGGTFAFGGLTQGPASDRMVEAATVAHQTFSTPNEGYELRILEIPELREMSLWLHGETADHFIPYVEGTPNAPQHIKVDSGFATRMVEQATLTREHLGLTLG